ncbi:MAG: hypothetical protein ABJP48_04140 [Erythrobacter sp.]
MTLEAIYFIGQTIAAIALVLSLIFVGIQIKQNTTQSKAEAAEAAHRAMIDWYYHQTPESAEIMSKAAQPDVELNDTERYQYFAITMPLLMNFQEAHLKWEAGSLEAVRWQYWDRFITIVSRSSSADVVWEQRKSHFTPGFQEYFQAKMDQRDGSLKGTWQKPNLPPEGEYAGGGST